MPKRTRKPATAKKSAKPASGPALAAGQPGNPATKPAKPATAKSRAIKITVAAARCPHGGCGSTARTGFVHVRERRIAGTIDGRAYSHIVWRSCKCRTCGRPRVEIHYENRP